VKITLIYYNNEKEKQFGEMILGQNWPKITPLQWTKKKKKVVVTARVEREERLSTASYSL
jgi:hypothetical protein